MDNNNVPMIPKHQAEAQMMHMSWTVRWLVIGIVIGFLCMVGMAFIFVNAYNTRTEKWIGAYAKLTEVLNEKEKTVSVQQYSVQ